MTMQLSTASISAFERHVLHERLGTFHKPAAWCDPHAVKALEKHLLDELELRLCRWGLWWYRGNILELNRATGKITRSPSANIMAYAPQADALKYAVEQDIDVDDVDAEALHRDITTRCTDRQVQALCRFYIYDNAPPTNAERLARYKAKRRILGM